MGYRPASAAEVPVRSPVLELPATKLFFFERGTREALHFAVFTPQSAPGTYSSSLLLFNPKAIARAIELLPRVAHLLPPRAAESGTGALYYGFSWDVQGRADGKELRRQRVDPKQLKVDVLDKLFWTSKSPARILSLFLRTDDGPFRWFPEVAVQRTVHIASLAQECGMDVVDVQRILAPHMPVIEQALAKRAAEGAAGTTPDAFVASLFLPETPRTSAASGP